MRIDPVSSSPSLRRLLLPDGTVVPADHDVITRGRNESLQLGADIRVIVVEIRGVKVRFAVDYPKDRLEVQRKD